MKAKIFLNVPNTNGQMAVCMVTNGIFIINDTQNTLIDTEIIDMSVYWGDEYSRTHRDLIRVITLMYIHLPVNKYKYIIVEKRDEISGCFWKDYWYRFEYPLESDIPGFFHIPYYTGHLVSEDGKIIHLNNSKQMTQWTPHVNSDKTYVTTPNLTCDVRVRPFKFKNDGNDVKFNVYKGTVLHRILALAFIPYSDNPNLIEVNHIDGVKSNYKLTNLEWVNRRDNFIHALKTGLRDDCDPVMVYDWFTRKEYKFYSKSEAARFTGVCSSTISNKTRINDQTTVLGRYSLKEDKVSNPWKYKTFKDAVNKSSQYVEALNIFTGEVIRVLGTHLLPTLLRGSNISRSMLSYLLHRLSKDGVINRPYDGYLFRYIADEIPFPKLSVEELIFYRKLKERNITHERCPFIIFKNGDFFDVAINKEEVCKIINIGRWIYERLMRGQPHETYVDPELNKWSIKKIYKYNSYLDRFE